MDLILLLQTAGPVRTASSPAFSLPPALLPAGNCTVSFPNPRLSAPPFPLLHSNVRGSIAAAASLSSTSPPASASPLLSPPRTHWLVVTEKPPTSASSKPEIVDYYVQTLARVLGSEKEAQMCIYDASWRTQFGFCCDIDEQCALDLARVPGVLSVRPDKDPESKNKDYSCSDELKPPLPKLFASVGNSEYWIVRMDKPGVEVVSKAQMVDYYAQSLMKVMGNERDAQSSIYNISWEEDYGFCCRIDEECARELADVPGVVSVQPDLNFESENKDYRGDAASKSKSSDSSEAFQSPEIKTKRLFVTGLSFYTSEKTLRAAFEGFGELVEVKIIMDKISKRSKGYAFIEYTTEESAGAALKEMNGKIINGWMIVVDVAKTNPPKYSRGRLQP